LILYGYLLLSVGMGVISNFVSAKWILVASALLIWMVIVASSWRWIDWNSTHLGNVVWRIISQGTVWYLIPSVLFFGIAFLVGRYTVLLVERTLQSIRG